MGGIMEERVVNNVTNILKTLDCAICLEILKNPVSMGCGHFFCRFCITEVLKSNYRTPCPLCKRSFTRRSIQDADQRQSVILAARKLADVCGKFTGVNFFPKESTQKDIENEEHLLNSSSSKTEEVMPQENCKTSVSKKRKSSEIANDETPGTKELATPKTNCLPMDISGKDSECVSANNPIPNNKRHCQLLHTDSDDEEEDLPSLAELLQGGHTSKIIDQQSVAIKEDNHESKNPRVQLKRINDTEYETKKSNESTDQNNVQISSVLAANQSNLEGLSEKKREKKGLQKQDQSSMPKENSKVLNVRRKVQSRKSFGSKMQLQTALKNEKNALRNKTNELTPKNNLTEDDCIIAKPVTDQIRAIHMEDLPDVEFVKENKKINIKLFESPVRSRKTKTRRSQSGLKRNEKVKKRHSRNETVIDKSESQTSSTEEEILISKLKEAENFQLTIVKNAVPSTIPLNEDGNRPECYNLSEIDIPYNDVSKNNDGVDGNKGAKLVPKLVEEPSKSDNIPDTAVSVQSVASPQHNKIDFLSKSPGWSKVKQVGKDFRVRKFSKLHVEKNSSNSSSDAVVLDINSHTDQTEKMKCKQITDLESDQDKDINAQVKNSKRAKELSEPTTKNTAFFEQDDMHSNCSLENANVVKPIVHFSESSSVNHNVLKEGGESDDGRENFRKDAANDSDIETNKSSVVKNMNHGISDQSELSNSNQIVTKQIESHVFEEVVGENNLLNCSSSHVDEVSAENAVLDHHGSHVTLAESTSNISSRDKSCKGSDGEFLVPNLKNNGENKFTHCHAKSDEAMEFDTAANYEIGKENSERIEVMEIDYCSANSDEQIKPMKNLMHNPELYGNQEKKYGMEELLPDPNLFKKHHFNKRPVSELVKAKNLPTKVSKISRCEITESFIDDDENIYYAEHSQQTSQRLLEYCGNNSRQPKGLLTTGAHYERPYSATKLYNMGLKHGVPSDNQVGILYKQEFSKTERTKVLKRTCLTLDEIIEAFNDSYESREAETICSLPFASGKFRLHVGVSEETLNISVLQVIEPEASNSMGSKTGTVLLSEKNVQTSNSPVSSPAYILSPSNAESESSQPSSLLEENTNKGYDPFPYLNKFIDSEPTEQKKEMHVNDSEIFPFINSSSRKLNSDEITTEHIYVVPQSDSIKETLGFSKNSSYLNVDDLPVTQPYCPKSTSEYDCKSPKEDSCCKSFSITENEATDKIQVFDAGKDINKPIEALNSKNVPDLAENKKDVSSNKEKSTQFSIISSKESDKMNAPISTNTPKNDDLSELVMPEKNSSPQKNQSTQFFKTSSPKEHKNVQMNLQMSKNSPKNDNVPDMTQTKENSCINKEKSDTISALVSDKENDNCQNKASVHNNMPTVVSSYPIMDDLSGNSSDPDMAFANELVAPLKSIAEKLKCSSTETKPKQMKGNFLSPQIPGVSRPRPPLEIFEELVLSKSNDTFANSQRSSRLSLKSKRNPKKFKRIKKYESGDDSDSSDSSKTESSPVRKLSTKGEPKNISPSENQITMKNDLPSESLQTNGTLNSFLSEDMTNVNSSEIVMEIEDLDQKILSVVEKLKKVGRADVLEDKSSLKLIDTNKKDLSISDDNCKSGVSDDSEDSIDLFAESVPPTPPEAATSNNDSVFTSALYNNNQ